jgi:hypothetical protein
MKVNVNNSLEGQFRVQIYSGKTLVEDTDFFNNFITPTGLYYPTIYPFVDCFRFLSLGTDTSTPNSGAVLTGVGGVITGSGIGTTGLASPIVSYGTNYGPQYGNYLGWQAYENGSDNSQSACGTLLTEQGPRFYRAWTIPTGGVQCTIQNGTNGLVINEFMVSPSSGSDPTGCFAFSRVRRTVTIPNGYSAIISYQLSINNQNTGLTFFNSGTFTTGNADVTSSPDDLGLVSGWGILSGYYRQVYHGLNVIDSLGAHFTPSYGCGMEPYLTDLSDYCFYLSPDNSAFDVSQTGNVQGSWSGAYQADGLMSTIFGIPMTYQNTSSPSDMLFYGPIPPAQSILNIGQSSNTPQNIRIGNANTFQIPSVTNYSTGENFSPFNYQSAYDATQEDISFATPGILGFNSNKVNYLQEAVFSTRIFRQPMDLTGGVPLNLITGRTKTITRKTLFSPVSSLGYNTRFGSLVFASNLAPGSNDSSQYWPMVDTLFYDTSGRSTMQHYRQIKVIMDNRGTGIADSYICITPSGQNISRFASRKTYQGPYSTVDGNPLGFDIDSTLMSGASNGYTAALTASTFNYVDFPLSGYSDPNNISGSGVGDLFFNFSPLTGYNCSGFGMVYGVIADDNTFYNTPYDCGLVDHNVTGGPQGLKVTPVPNATGTTIYWPNKNFPLSLQITGIKYFSNGTCFGGVTVPVVSGQTGYNWSTNPCHFCPPTGHIEHWEVINGSGYRLLPNSQYPNNVGNNYYSANLTSGGSLPGLSFDNGLELLMQISWGAGCSDAINCL